MHIKYIKRTEHIMHITPSPRTEYRVARRGTGSKPGSTPGSDGAVTPSGKFDGMFDVMVDGMFAGMFAAGRAATAAVGWYLWRSPKGTSRRSE